MKKILCLVLVFLLAVGSSAGYIILNKLIAEGSMKIAAGEVQIKQGEEMLANGKKRLANGERQLSQGKQVYHGMKNTSFLGSVAGIIAPPLAVVAVAGTQATGQKITAGEKQVAAGKKKIASGEDQLAAGKIELARGIERLNHAKWIRTACGFSSIFFSVLFVFLMIRWRKVYS